MPSSKLDDIDLRILEVLQHSGRTKRNQIAEEVKLSIPSVSERLRKLEESGIIRGYTALVEPKRVGLNINAFIFLTVESSKYYQSIIEQAQAAEEVLECHAITGDGSHVLKIQTETTETLEKLLGRIQAWPGVTNTHTDIVLSSPKNTTEVPVTQCRKPRP